MPKPLGSRGKKKHNKEPVLKYRKEKVDKADCQKVHAQVRARTRFKMEMNDVLYARIVKAIQAGGTEDTKITHKYNQSTRVKVCVVELLDTDFPPFEVCYDRERNTIVTLIEEREGIFIPRMVDVFGNVKSVKNEFGVNSIRLDDEYNVVNLPYEQIIMTKVNGHYLYEFVEKRRTYRLDGNILKEVMV